MANYNDGFPFTIEERVQAVSETLSQLAQAQQVLKAMQIEYAKTLQQTRNAMELLADILGGLEYVEDFKTWVSKKKLAEFKKNPREEKKGDG